MEEERRNLEPGVGRSARRRKEASGPKETGGGSRRDDALTQERAPIYEALEAFQKMRVVPFDVPGHKRGRGNPELTKLLGETCMRLDVNSMNRSITSAIRCPSSRMRSSWRLRHSGRHTHS